MIRRISLTSAHIVAGDALVEDRLTLADISIASAMAAPTDVSSVTDLLERVAPTEIYNLAGQSSVAVSFSQPVETLEGIVFGTVNLLEALHRVWLDNEITEDWRSKVIAARKSYRRNPGSRHGLSLGDAPATWRLHERFHFGGH
jgi:hypothetical protein